MKFVSKIAVSALALTVAAPMAFAQETITGIRAVEENISDLNRDIQRDISRGEDAARYGSVEFAPGWTGSVSAALSATSGNSDTADLSFGGRFRYGQGVYNHTFGFLGEVGEADDRTTKEDYYAVYDVNRSFTEQFYMFGLARAQYGIASEDRNDDFVTDAFLGFGPGFRIINNQDMAWRLQAGPGVRYTKDADNREETELAGIASSRFFYRINPGVFVTNDTDVLYSDANTRVTNDLGVSVSMTDTLSTRVSYFTDYNSDPAAGLENTDNTVKVSLVYSFR
ncbi:DUF481 domain-containing protein [Profundibacterium mesophilum]|uniref:Salt-stress induced outer membrane protein n=1 Tax=Profundibacterium mesophilum KAUST100406-0324 TaxID=1037889 RepID=A0A921NT19_9RHOB|nr:DUF481 domain-containing protein [Profundibacterium mesophilum]KAF0674943.1 Salt-stress induced outer membrane protein [Profundibacterium mesophilum KAUST100406-0324]